MNEAMSLVMIFFEANRCEGYYGTRCKVYGLRFNVQEVMRG
jgi:hypothetical protein